jgi:hypothetical protein
LNSESQKECQKILQQECQQRHHQLKRQNGKENIPPCSREDRKDNV